MRKTEITGLWAQDKEEREQRSTCLVPSLRHPGLRTVLGPMRITLDLPSNESKVVIAAPAFTHWHQHKTMQSS